MSFYEHIQTISKESVPFPKTEEKIRARIEDKAQRKFNHAVFRYKGKEITEELLNIFLELEVEGFHMHVELSDVLIYTVSWST